MPFTPEQIARAEEQQWSAARDDSPQVRLVAGPGTGKSHTIEKRIVHLLEDVGVAGERLFVISFTRATCAELRGRVRDRCAGRACAQQSTQVQISTMHSLALRILRRANLLTAYPSTPILLDDWEQTWVYDRELAAALQCPRSRATQIRLAHDAYWQTLDPAEIDQAQITAGERTAFGAFHGARTHLYSCVLPGEVIYKCVEAFRMGTLQPDRLPPIEQLIVDEYQDLNACDQEFVRHLCANGVTLFVAGDDDQSIYSFRHANPDGIVQFEATYPDASTHVLTDCFRCTGSVLRPAERLIVHNPNRLPKDVVPLYDEANPPVPGQLMVWGFATAQAEARAVAESCRALIDGGMQGREDQILILIRNRRLQLGPLAEALNAAGVPFDPPRGASLRDEHEAFRALYSLLRITREQQAQGDEDYPAYRDLLTILHGVGDATAKQVGDECIAHNQNFRDLFSLPAVPAWLTGRASAGVERVTAAATEARAWAPLDTLAARGPDIIRTLNDTVFPGRPAETAEWNGLAGQLPPEMTLEELLAFFQADTEADQQSILEAVAARIGAGQIQGGGAAPTRVRLLTMHGAKGLSGSVVFIPSAEQRIIPSAKAMRATGLLIEERRLFYVSLSRAKACCIVSHVNRRTGADAQMLAQRQTLLCQRSVFLDDMAVPSVLRGRGLAPGEAAQIINEVNSL
ncbi:MAG: ATP-dependent helicase [Deltaproteobacteria bacterium]|nr:ATP-dependent helicase [Deltaproteobacteria bacterium]